MIKKTLVLLFLVVIGSISNAQVNIGKEIGIYSENGKPKFGAQFAHERQTTMFSATITVSGRDLVGTGGLLNLTYRLYDSKTGAYVSEWTALENRPTPVYLSGTYVIPVQSRNAPDAVAIIKSLPSLKIVLVVNGDLSNPTPTHNIPLNDYCVKNPDHFLDLSTGSTGCAVSR